MMQEEERLSEKLEGVKAHSGVHPQVEVETLSSMNVSSCTD